MSHVHNRIGQITPCLVNSAATAACDGDAARLAAQRCAASSSFAHMAEYSQTLSVRADEAIGPLLAAATVTRADMVSESCSIWKTEALHRAHATLKLFLMLHRSRRRVDRLTRVLERHLAIDLARNMYALTHPASAKAENCARPLRDIVAGLVALFGPGVGDLDVETDMSEVLLAGQRRRALALLMHELVANAILHAFTGRCRGRIIVTIRLVSPGVAALSVMDDGVGISDDTIAAGGIAASLAEILGSDLYHTRTISGFTRIESVFKVEQRERRPTLGHPIVRPENAYPNDERSCEAGRL
jgi:two-component sensor histidine kinase